MKLSDVLNTVDTLVPNALPTSLKIQWVNQIMNQLHRDYPFPDAVHPFQTVVGEAAYILPFDVSEDRIAHLVIGEEEYPYSPLAVTDTYDKFWAVVVTGDILIHPVPKKVEDGVLYYRPRPVQMTEADLDDTPSFPADYHELLVFGVAARVAKVSKDTLDLVSMYEADFQQLAEKANRMLTKRKPKTVTIMRAWM